MNRFTTCLRQCLANSTADSTEDVPGLRPEAIELSLQISPWALWLLIGLIRHRTRQQWVADLIRFRLQGEPEHIARAGAFGHPEIPRQGLVPGDSDWEYCFHGCGCRLDNRLTGECIDVDFFDDTADWFDVYFYRRYLDSLSDPPFPERRLKSLHRSNKTLTVAFDELLNLGVLETHGDRHPVRLLPEVVELTTQFELAFENCRDLIEQLRIAKCLGDWLFVNESEADAVQVDVTERVDRIRQNRGHLLTKLFESDDKRVESLYGLSDLESPLLDHHLRKAMEGPLCGVTSAAMELIALRPGDWSTEVYGLYRRTNPAGEIPNPHLWQVSLEYLLRRGFRRDELSSQLIRAGKRAIADAALLALEFAPHLARQLFRRALRSNIPLDRIESSAMLAVLDESWCREEMLAVLRESDDQQLTCDCRAALMMSRDHSVHTAVADWERQHPHDPAQGPYYTFDELSLRDRDDRMRYEMARLHDRVILLRGKSPPEPAKPWRWWPFS